MRNKVRDFRVRKSLTQQDLAASVGVSRQSIIAIESGKYVPSTLLALKLAARLDAPVETLFRLEADD